MNARTVNGIDYDKWTADIEWASPGWVIKAYRIDSDRRREGKDTVICTRNKEDALKVFAFINWEREAFLETYPKGLLTPCGT